jgi:hypothetical protein
VDKEPPELIRLEVVRVQPGDILVLTCPERLTENDVECIREQIGRTGLAGLEAVFLDGGMTLSVVRREGGQ